MNKTANEIYKEKMLELIEYLKANRDKKGLDLAMAMLASLSNVLDSLKKND